MKQESIFNTFIYFNPGYLDFKNTQLTFNYINPEISFIDFTKLYTALVHVEHKKNCFKVFSEICIHPQQKFNFLRTEQLIDSSTYFFYQIVISSIKELKNFHTDSIFKQAEFFMIALGQTGPKLL